MNKKTIIYISIAVGAVILIAVGIFLIFTLTSNTNEDYKTKKVTIQNFDENFEVDKTIEITDKNKIKQLREICNGISLEKDNTTETLAIRNDVKINLNNGVVLYIQLDYDKYCFIENSNKNIRQIITMPEGLFEYVNNILNENN